MHAGRGSLGGLLSDGLHRGDVLTIPLGSITVATDVFAPALCKHGDELVQVRAKICELLSQVLAILVL